MMIKKLPALLLLACFALTASAQTTTQKLIHYWHFNNTPGGHLGPNPIYADYSTFAAGKAYIVYKPVKGVVSDTGYIDNVSGDTTNARQGQTGGLGVRTRNPSDSMEFVWKIPTKNYKNIVLKYATQASSFTSGQRRQNLSYSLDSGTTYITTGLPVLFVSADTLWSKITLDLSKAGGVNNQNYFLFKIRLDTPNVITSGNNRFDNITVEGDTLTTTGTSFLQDAASAYSLFPNPARSEVFINAPGGGAKKVTLLNALGETLWIDEKQGTQFSVQTAPLAPGLYYIKIYTPADDQIVSLKFLKQ